jgi:CDP-2,3-bis-(O-geranylgeranyl)-sn-glycerol synthase
MLSLVLSALWFILPAYVANAAAVFSRGRTPIDLGIKFFDGRRVLGKSKTIRGFILGVLCGVVVGVAQGFIGTQVLMANRIALAFLLSAGAMTGDLVGSFLKRRLNIPAGGAVPFLDQWGFIVMAFAFAWLGAPLTGIAFPDLTVCLLILVLTAFAHTASNYLAFRLGLKEVPW